MGGSRRPPLQAVHADFDFRLAAIPGIFRERNLMARGLVASEMFGSVLKLGHYQMFLVEGASGSAHLEWPILACGTPPNGGTTQDRGIGLLFRPAK